MASRSESRSDGSNDNSADSVIVAAQKSDNKIKGQRGAKYKFRKMLKLSPPTTPEPVRQGSDFKISIAEDDKSKHQHLPEQPVLRSPEYHQAPPTPPLPSNVHVTDKYRPVTQRGSDYNILNDMVSL